MATKQRALSKMRSAAGKSGADKRWGGRFAKATACIRVYPSDADRIRREASALKRLPADVVADLLRNER